ncbi:MAG: hypothetical protein HZC05_04275 [Candidatus Magasanikbacteria bacterium]|nr:hypothetical protein [Candidatus Magasanikbacteria bacterium]
MPPDQEMQKILERNTQALEENVQLLKSIHRAMLLGRVLSILKLLIFVVPLILAYIYLQPYYKDTMKLYKEFFSSAPANNGLKMLLPELQEIMGGQKK